MLREAGAGHDHSVRVPPPHQPWENLAKVEHPNLDGADLSGVDFILLDQQRGPDRGRLRWTNGHDLKGANRLGLDLRWANMARPV